jgi:hypothetical protein
LSLDRILGIEIATESNHDLTEAYGVRRSIPEKETKALIALSGGVCAFPGCHKRLVEHGNDLDAAAFLGEMAHIVADSRQGPRGDSPMSDEERDRHTNLLLLCGDHHKTIDSQPRTCSVSVLRRIKEDHEGRILRATGGKVEVRTPILIREVIHSTLLAVTHLPAAVFAAPCAFHDRQDDQVRERIRFPDDDTQLVRFLLRDGKLFTFHNLKDPKGPFRDVINQKGVEMLRSEQLWDDPEGHRRYVTLLNKGLYKYAARKRVRYDPAHKRFFFEAVVPGEPRQEQYRPLNAKHKIKRNVVSQPKSRAGSLLSNFWWHLAVGLTFQRNDKRQWSISIRPERHLTSDGVTPLAPKQIGRRVTKKKARMWNDIYLGEVNFWRDFLSGGGPKIVLNFGDQSAVIDTEMLTFIVDWPGIPGDTKPFTNTTYDMDISSQSEFDDALTGDDLELDWGDDEEIGEDQDD